MHQSLLSQFLASVGLGQYSVLPVEPSMSWYNDPTQSDQHLLCIFGGFPHCLWLTAEEGRMLPFAALRHCNTVLRWIVPFNKKDQYNFSSYSYHPHESKSLNCNLMLFLSIRNPFTDQRIFFCLFFLKNATCWWES